MTSKSKTDKGFAKEQGTNKPLSSEQMSALTSLINKLSELYRVTAPVIRPGQRLLTIEQAGIYLGRSTYSVRTLIWGGALSYVKDDNNGRPGRKMWIDIEDLDRWIINNKDRMSELD